jgi:hypothetical protein
MKGLKDVTEGELLREIRVTELVRQLGMTADVIRRLMDRNVIR